MSKEQELKEEHQRLLKRIDEEEKELKDQLAKNEKLKEETFNLKLKLAEVNGENNIMKKDLGWEGIEDHEIKWLMKNQNKFNTHKPSLEMIRSKMKQQNL